MIPCSFKKTLFLIISALSAEMIFAADVTISNDTTVTTTQNPQTNSTLTNNGMIYVDNIFNDIHFGSAVMNNSSASNSVVINNGSITGGYVGIFNGNGTNLAIINNASGSINSLSFTAVFNSNNNNQPISSLTNYGVINGSALYADIVIYSGLTTLNNAQGGNIATAAQTALTYSGVLPNNYSIIIKSPLYYGQLAANNNATTISGIMAFGIYSGSTVRTGTPYAAVLSGVTASQILNKSGIYSGYSWALGLESGSSDTWDLIFATYVPPVTGPSVANTNQSLVNTASALQGTYTLQNSVLANSFSYDCTVFGANDVCVSAGGRNTQVQAANGLNNTSALLIAAYRPHPNYRIGAYADQNLSASNPGGTVNLGNNTPLIGLFAAWNERLDGTGTEVKVSAAYGQKNTTINRSVVGSGATASEAGSGSSTLNSQGAQATAKYGFGILDNVIVSPYVGVRYTQNNMGGYTEGASSSVTAPLTYSALNTNATTALAGVGASYRVIPAVMTFASAGVETDTNTANGTYSATNASIGTLTPVNFNANPVRTRPTATVGAYYDIEKNQRLGITGIYRQEAYQAVSTTTVMATYTIGL
ncbi:autotransporter outer membrane beta-barrel domain-containing protein [Polynucleobacter paneuropaeus]|nr:autotransporter outer membrane beta-barrel domain-containing protein [Polynucleobacter paneuropaeus]